MKKALNLNQAEQNSLIKIGEAAKQVGVSIDTLRRWEKAGKVPVTKTAGGTRLYSNFVKIGEAAKELSISIDTLRRWEKGGKITALRTPGGTRLYSLETLRQINPQLEQASSKTQVDPILNKTPKPSPVPSPSVTPVIKKSIAAEEIIKWEWENFQRRQPQYQPVNNERAEENYDLPEIAEANQRRIYAKIYARIYALLPLYLALLLFSAVTTSAIIAAHIISPQSTKEFLTPQNQRANIAAKLLSPFDLLGKNTIYYLFPDIATKLGFTPSATPEWEKWSVRELTNSSVLAAASVNRFLEINSDTAINGKLAVSEESVFGGNITAPNIIYSLTAGSGVSVSTGQRPTISSSDTLALVTGRGATTTTLTTFSGGINLGNIINLGQLSSDPSSSINGATYYNTTSNVFRCYQNGSWKNCDTDTTSSGDITAVSVGNGLSGGGSSGDVTVSLDVTTSSTTSTTTANSGLETASDGLSLLRGCNNNQSLVWDTGTTAWVCGSPTGIIDVQESGSTILATVDTLNYAGGDFDFTTTGSNTVNIQLASQLENVTGVAGDFDVVGTLTAGTADAFQVSAAGGITIPSSQTLTVGTVGLSATGSDNTTSGATLIGVYGEFNNASSGTLQEVLNSLDAAIGGGASKWTQASGFAYLANDTDDFVLGGTTIAGATLYFDESASNLYLGTNESANGILTLYSSGAGITDPTITTNATGQLIIDSTNFDVTATGINSAAIGTDTPSTGAFTTLSSTGATTLSSGAGVATTIGNTTGTFQLESSALDISTAGAITDATGITSSGTITFSGLLTDGVVTVSSGALSSEASLAIARGGIGTTSAPTSGQLLIGNSSNGYTVAALSAGTGIGVTNASGSITITNSGVTQLNSTNNQVNVSATTGNITLSTPQDIHNAATPTFASMTLSSSTNQISLGSTRTITLAASIPDVSRTYTIPDFGSNDTFAGLAATQTLTNKTVTDSSFTIQDNLDTNKKLMFDIASVGTGTTLTLSLPSNPGTSDTFCLLTAANCSGTGAGIGGSGTANYLTKFTGQYNVGNASITDDGSTVTLSTDTDITLEGSENVALSNSTSQSDLFALSSTIADTYSADAFQITVTDNTSTSGTGRGLVIETGDGSASLDAALAINHTDTGQALTSGLIITGAASTAITTAIDVSDPEIVTALNVGPNSIIGTTGLINFDNFDVDASGDLTAGTYNGQTISSIANFTGTVQVTTSVTSPIYTGTGAVTLSSAGGSALTLDSSSGTVVINSGDALQLGSGTISSNNQAITINSGSANQVNLGASDSLTNSTWTISGAGAISGVTTIAATGAITAATATNTINGIIINSGAVSSVDGLTITAGNDLTIGTIGLGNSGSGNTTSGAALIGVYPEFTNAQDTDTTLQEVLNALDAAIGSGASKWTHDSTFTYLTTDTDDVAIGGTTIAGATLYFDESASNLYLGTNESANGILTLYSSGAGITDPTITTNATGQLIIDSTNFDVTATGINSAAIGTDTPSTGAFTTLSSTGATTLGNDSSTVAIDTTSWNVTSAGAISGVTTIEATGAITAATATNTINGIIINAGAISDVDGLTINAGSDLTIGTVGLSSTGSSNTTSGATLVGVYDEFTNASEADTTIQKVLKAFDSAIGGGASKWLITSNVLHPNTITDDFGIGGTSLVAPFSVDVSANLLRIGDGANDANTPTITFYASDATNDGSLLFNDSDQFQFSNADVTIDQTLVLSSSDNEGISGGGLVDCNNATESKLLWDADTNKFSCGTDGGSGTGSSKWTDTGPLTYLTHDTDDLAVGGTALAAAFSVDVSANTARIGTGTSANATLSLYASDGNTGNLAYNTSDQFQFSGGNVVIDQDLTITGNDITFGNAETISNQTNDQLIFGIGGTNELTLSASALYPATAAGLDLGASANQFADLYLSGGNINLDNATDIDIDDALASALTVSEASNNYLAITTSNGTENVSFGNATTNPSYSFLGSGTATFNGLLNANLGLGVSGGNLTVNTNKFIVDYTNGDTTIAGTAGVTGLITASGGVTLPANQNLTLSSGTGTITQTYSNSSGTAATFNATNSAASGTNSINGLSIALSGTATSGTNTLIGLNFANVSTASNNTFTAINIGSSYDNLLTYSSGGFTGTVQTAGLTADHTITLPNATGTVCVQNGGSSNCTFISSFILAGETGVDQTITTGNTLTLAAGDGINTVGSDTDTITISVQDDSLDFAQFEDTLDLDASLTLNQGTSTWTQNYSGTSNGFTIAASDTGTPLALTSSSTGTLLSMTATGTGTTPTALSIANTSSGAITTAIDLSDTEIATALALGLNDITVNNVTISAAEFAILDDKINLASSDEVTGILPIANAGTGTTAVPSNGQLLIGNGTNYTVASLQVGTGVSATTGAGTLTLTNTGVTSLIATENQVGISASTGAVTLTTPQDIHTAATPTFGSMTLSATTNQMTLGTTNTTTISSVAPSTSRIATLPALSADDTFVFLNQAQTLTNKTFTDSSTYIQDNLDNTKKLMFDAANVGTGTTTTLTLPSGVSTSDEICLLSGNCASSAAGLGGSGTSNTLAKFTGTYTLGDASITDDGSSVTLSTNTDFNLEGSENLTLTNTSASTDQMALAVSGVTTNGADALSIAFTQADDSDATDTNAALNIAITSSSTDADTLYGLNIAAISGGAASETAINIGTGWDTAIGIGGTNISPIELAYLDGGIDLSGSEVTGTLTVSKGGTGATTLTSNGVLYGQGASNIAATTAGTSGQLLVANVSGVPTFVTMDSDATLSNDGALTIAADAVTLGTDTTGAYIATISSGSGISVSGSGAEMAAATVSLSSLTSNWTQSNAYDIVLDNTSSELSIRESTPGVGATYYGTLDIGDLGANAIYTFSGTSGTVLTSANALFSSAVGTGSTASYSGLETSSNQIGLVQNCGDGQILKWNDVTQVWYCADDTGVATAVVNVQEEEVGIGTSVTTLKFINAFDLTDVGGNTVTFDIKDDSLDFSELANSLTLDDDASTTIATGNFDIIFNLSGTGNFRIQDNGTDFFWADDGGNIGIGTTAPGQLLTVNGTFGIGDSDNSWHTIFQGGDQSADITYTLPTALPGAGTTGFMKVTSAGTMSFDTTSYLTEESYLGTVTGSGSSGSLPIWNGTSSLTTTTNLPTATTIGSQYIYRVGGNDVAVADGGTSKSAWTQYAIPYLSNTTTFGEIGIGTSTYLLTSAGTSYAWTDPATFEPALTKGDLGSGSTALTITDGAGAVIGTGTTLTLDSDLESLAGLSTSGVAVRTGDGTWATRTLTAPAAGFTITNPAGLAGDPTFVLANDLSAVEGIGTSGMVQRTAADTWSTVYGTDNYLPKWSSGSLSTTSLLYDTGTLVGIGTTVPEGKLGISSTSEQLRLLYDTDSYASLTVGNDSDLTIKPAETGQLIFQPTTDSTTFLQVLDTDGGTPILNIDATNERVGIGTTEPSKLLAVAGDAWLQGDLYLAGAASSASTTEGTIYYDTDDDQLKVYANGKWQSDRTTATKIVATTNTGNPSQNSEKADYVCGDSDCDTTIETAISALPTNGGVVVLSEGTYVIDSDGIDITKSNVSIIGTGKATILQRGYDTATNDGVITVGDGGTTNVVGVTIANLSIDGQEESFAGSQNIGILFNYYVTDSTIRNNWIYNNDGDGIRFEAGFSSSTGNHRNLIESNNLSDNLSDIYLEAHSSYNIISNNILRDSDINGTFGSITISYNSHYNIVTNNTISGALRGIYIDALGTKTSGNYVYNTTYNAILATENADRSTISSNEIYEIGNNGTGISAASDNTTISSNNIYDSSGTTTGISITGNTNYLIGNEISGAGMTTRINDGGTGTTIQQRDQFEVETALATGNIFNLDWTGATSLTGATNGLNLTFTDITGNGQNFNGIYISDVGTAGAGAEYGLNIAGTDWDYGIYAENSAKWVLPAAGQLIVDAAATDNTTTSGVINLDVDSLTTGNIGLSIDYQDTNTGASITQYASKIDVTIDANATGDDTVYGQYIGMTQSDTGATAWGLYITGEDKNYFSGNLGIGTTAPSSLLHLVSSATTTDVMTIDATSLSSGSGLVLTGPSSGTAGVTDAVLKITSDVGNIGGSSFSVPNGVISSTVTVDTTGFVDSAANLNLSTINSPTSNSNYVYGIYNSVRDATTGLASEITGIKNNVALTSNGGKIATGSLSNVTSSSTTADTLTGYYATTSVTGAIGVNTRNVYGVRSELSSTGASTGGTTNVYGLYSEPDGTVGGASANLNVYGLYVADDTMNTTGNTKHYGIYVESITGADNNYAAIFAGGNVGIGTTAPGGTLVVDNGANAVSPLIIQDNGTAVFTIADVSGTAADGLTLTGGTTGVGVTLASSGETNVPMLIDTAGTGALNIGTGSNAKTITLGNATTSTALAFNSGTGSQTFTSQVVTGTTTTSGFVFDATAITTGTAIYLTSDSITEGKMLDLNTGSANTLTTGTMLNIASTATSLSTGSLLSLDWSPTATTTATGDLFSIGIGTSGNVGNLFNIKDTGSSLFSVSEVAMTSTQPVAFNAPGDVAIAYDLVFTNPTASYIKSQAPLSIEAGEVFNSSDLTLKTYNAGSVVVTQDNQPTAAGTAYAFQLLPTLGSSTSALTYTADYSLYNVPTINHSGAGGTVSAVYNNYSGLTATAGTVTNWYANYVAAPTGSGTVSNKYAFVSEASSGNFGIGTTAPASLLEVNGVASVGLGSTAAPSLAFNGDLNTGIFSPGADTVGIGVSGTEKVRIDSTGLGIGTTAPGLALDVVGSARFSSVGSGAFSAALNITSDGTLTTDTSDIRLKTNLSPLSDSLDKIMQLQTYSFNWISDPQGSKQVGLVAQEVAQIIPEVTFTNPTDGYMGINYSHFAPFLIGAIQEQQNQLNSLISANGLSINADGTLSAGDIYTDKIKLSSAALSTSLLTTNGTSISTIDDAIIAIDQQLTDTQTKLANLDLKVTTLEDRMKNQELTIKDLQDKIATMSGMIAGINTATDSAESTSSAVILNASEGSLTNVSTASAVDSSPSAQNDNSSLNLTPPQLLSATESATLKDLTVVSEATVSGILTAYDTVVQNTFKSLGETFLGNTTIAGGFSVDGTLSLSGNSLSTIGTLYLQNGPLADNIDLFNGLITLGKDGTITARKLVLPSEVLGSATIPVGQTALPIWTDALTDKSKIFLTPTTLTGGQALVVTYQEAGLGFVVSLDHIYSQDINFNWMIIDEAN